MSALWKSRLFLWFVTIKEHKKVRFWVTNKLKAYELLGKHLKLFTDKIESENTNHNIEIKLEPQLEEWSK